MFNGSTLWSTATGRFVDCAIAANYKTADFIERDTQVHGDFRG